MSGIGRLSDFARTSRHLLLDVRALTRNGVCVRHRCRSGRSFDCGVGASRVPDLVIVQLRVDSQGRIAWKATPDLGDYLTDLRLDAEADLEDEEV
jgi:hypothetical protein